jgi:hypothetical protein
MATGPEHYRRAEELLLHAYEAEPRCPEESSALAAAQVHATLALAAATALNDFEGGMSSAELSEWHEACAKGTATAGPVGGTEGTCPGGC